MSISVSIEGLAAVEQALTMSVEGMIPDAEKGLRQGLELIKRSAKELVPTNTGELRNSITTDVMHVNDEEIVGDVYTPQEYALPVEMGSGEVGKASGGNGSPVKVSYRTGAWFVPLKRGAVMMADTVLEEGSEGFMTRGQPARPFLYPAFKANRGKVAQMIRNAIKRGLRG